MNYLSCAIHGRRRAPRDLLLHAARGVLPLDEERAVELEAVLKALADRHRLRIVNLLLRAGGEPVCVCEIQPLLGLSQGTVSYHLKQLVEAGVIARETRGTYSYFSLVPGGARCGARGLRPGLHAACW